MYMYIFIALVIFMIIVMIRAWSKNMKTVRSAENKARLRIFSKKSLIMSTIWLAITLFSIIVNTIKLFNAIAQQDNYIADHTYMRKTAWGSEIKETVTSTPFDDVVKDLRLSLVFFALILLLYILYNLSTNSSYITEKGIFHGVRSYRPDEIKYIMEDDMEKPVLIYRRTNKEFIVRKVSDTKRCREIITEYYKNAKYYSEHQGLKYGSEE